MLRMLPEGPTGQRKVVDQQSEHARDQDKAAVPEKGPNPGSHVRRATYRKKSPDRYGTYAHQP